MPAAVTGLPCNGSVIYARLWSLTSTAWLYRDYSFTTCAMASMSSPAPGASLTSTSVTFQWTPGAGSSAYRLSISRSPGGADLCNQYVGGSLSVSCTGLPSDGSPLFVRLWSLFPAGWWYVDYIYTSVARATMSTPTPGGQLTSRNVTFTWSARPGVATYQLSVSRIPGGAELYNQYLGPATAATVTGLPNGGEVYVRLWSLIGGQWHYSDYQYTACLGCP